MSASRRPAKFPAPSVVAVRATGPSFAARAERFVQEIELELRIGDAVQIGDTCYVVLDIDNGEVCFRAVPAEDYALPPEIIPSRK